MRKPREVAEQIGGHLTQTTPTGEAAWIDYDVDGVESLLRNYLDEVFGEIEQRIAGGTELPQHIPGKLYAVKSVHKLRALWSAK